MSQPPWSKKWAGSVRGAGVGRPERHPVGNGKLNGSAACWQMSGNSSFAWGGFMCKTACLAQSMVDQGHRGSFSLCLYSELFLLPGTSKPLVVASDLLWGGFSLHTTKKSPGEKALLLRRKPHCQPPARLLKWLKLWACAKACCWE